MRVILISIALFAGLVGKVSAEKSLDCVNFGDVIHCEEMGVSHGPINGIADAYFVGAELASDNALRQTLAEARDDESDEEL